VKVVDRRADELKPYPGNPRIPGQAIHLVAESIREFGWRQPIVVDEKDEIIVGHTRQLAAFELGQEFVPVHVAEGLTDEQKRAYRLADNRLNEYGKWDVEMLKTELTELASLGLNLEMTGFSPGQLRKYAGADLSEPDPIGDAEERVQLGELWKMGEHVILCGDATKAEDVARLLEHGTPALMVTDPPYGVSYDPTWRSDSGLANDVEQPKILNESRVDWREAWALFPGEVAYVWHSGLHAATVEEGLVATGFQIRAQIIWAKPSMAISRGHYHWQHEPCWFAIRHDPCYYAVKKGHKAHWTGSRAETTLWNLAGDEFMSNHPNQKPLEAMARPMLNNSVAGDFVYDPFAGSGTAIIAAEKTERRCLAIELDPHFSDVALTRWEELTGGKAVQLG